MRMVFLDELNMLEFSERVKNGGLVILPMGSVEEHGEHLPLCTDSIQSEALARRLADKLDAMIAPAIRYGECQSTRNFPGTITISFDTLRALVREVLEELYRNGVRRILVITGHAGRAHMIALREAGREVVYRHPDLKLMVLSDYEIAYDLLGKGFDKDDGHAGTIETSRMMQLRPELVKGRPRKAKARPPKYLIVHDPERFIPRGIWGDPSKATAEKGKKVEDYVFKELVKLIRKDLMS
jgi:creatinine amidohydrolase